MTVEPREPGPYWCYYVCEWCVLEWTCTNGEWHWWGAGAHEPIDPELIVTVGEPIPSHTELRELRIKASNWDVHEAECRKVGLTIEEAARILYGGHP